MMKVREAQFEVRSVFWGGSVGQAVSGIIWLISSIFAAWYDEKTGMLILFFGGMFIFPLTQLVFRLMGKKASLSKDNPFTALSMQTAFIVPLLIPVIYGAALYNGNWFYPAFMIVVGAHYLPFMTLYGMRLFGLLAGILIIAGVLIGLYFSSSFVLGGWVTAVVLFVFAGLLWMSVKKEKLL